MTTTTISDPASWEQWCPLGCHREFDSRAGSFAPLERHRYHASPPCEMALALYRAVHRSTPKPDVEDWSRLPWQECPLGCSDGIAGLPRATAVKRHARAGLPGCLWVTKTPTESVFDQYRPTERETMPKVRTTVTGYRVRESDDGMFALTLKTESGHSKKATRYKSEEQAEARGMHWIDREVVVNVPAPRGAENLGDDGGF